MPARSVLASRRRSPYVLSLRKLRLKSSTAVDVRLHPGACSRPRSDAARCVASAAAARAKRQRFGAGSRASHPPVNVGLAATPRRCAGAILILLGAGRVPARGLGLRCGVAGRGCCSCATGEEGRTGRRPARAVPKPRLWLKATAWLRCQLGRSWQEDGVRFSPRCSDNCSGRVLVFFLLCSSPRCCLPTPLPSTRRRAPLVFLLQVREKMLIPISGSLTF